MGTMIDFERFSDIISLSCSIGSAHVAELVDAHGSGPCAARCGGSSPSVGTSLLSENRISVVSLPV